MANYDSTPNEVVNSISSSGITSPAISSFISRLLEDEAKIRPITVENDITTANAATSSNADVMFITLGDGERGSADSPVQFDGSGRDTGQAFIFQNSGNETVVGGSGDDGIFAEFNTVESIIVGAGGSDEFTVNGDQNTTVDGGAGSDTITTSGGDDSIVGGAGDDSIASGAGNDSIYGGAGDDVAALEGNADQYSIEQNGAITIVTNTETGVVKEVVSAETLSFADGEQAVEVSSDVQALTTLYKQLFSDNEERSQNGEGQADLEGLQYWDDRAEEGNSLGQIALSMLNSDEAGNQLDALDLNTSEGIKATIELLFTDVLGREVGSISQVEMTYWTDQAEAGATLDQIAGYFMASAELQDQSVNATEWDFLL